jgi:hypothetical protein
VKESDLYAPVRDWLVARGYEVHVELFGHDIVAMKDGQATVVELKLGATLGLMNQLANAAKWANVVIGAVATEPRSTNAFRYYGFGLLQVDAETGKVRQRVHAKPQPYHWHKRQAYRLKVISKRKPALPHEVAGLPCCPQLRRQRQIRKLAG